MNRKEKEKVKKNEIFKLFILKIEREKTKETERNLNPQSKMKTKFFLFAFSSFFFFLIFPKQLLTQIEIGKKPNRIINWGISQSNLQEVFLALTRGDNTGQDVLNE